MPGMVRRNDHGGLSSVWHIYCWKVRWAYECRNRFRYACVFSNVVEQERKWDGIIWIRLRWNISGLFPELGSLMLKIARISQQTFLLGVRVFSSSGTDRWREASFYRNIQIASIQSVSNLLYHVSSRFDHSEEVLNTVVYTSFLLDVENSPVSPAKHSFALKFHCKNRFSSSCMKIWFSHYQAFVSQLSWLKQKPIFHVFVQFYFSW